MDERDILLERKAVLESEMDSIRSQIADAKSHAAATGNYSDRGWFIRANDALRHKGRECQRIQRELAKLKRNRAATWEREFVNAAKRRLKPEVYDSLMDEAHENYQMQL